MDAYDPKNEPVRLIPTSGWNRELAEKLLQQIRGDAMSKPVDLDALRALAGAQDYVEHINLMEAAADELAVLRQLALAAERNPCRHSADLKGTDCEVCDALAAWRELENGE